MRWVGDDIPNSPLYYHAAVFSNVNFHLARESCNQRHFKFDTLISIPNG